MAVKRTYLINLLPVLLVLALAACDSSTSSGGMVESQVIEYHNHHTKYSLVGTWKYTRDNTGPITDTRTLALHPNGQWVARALLMQSSGTWRHHGTDKIVLKCTSCTPVETSTMTITWHGKNHITLHDTDGSWVEMVRQ